MKDLFCLSRWDCDVGRRNRHHRLEVVCCDGRHGIRKTFDTLVSERPETAFKKHSKPNANYFGNSTQKVRTLSLQWHNQIQNCFKRCLQRCDRSSTVAGWRQQQQLFLIRSFLSGEQNTRETRFFGKREIITMKQNVVKLTKLQKRLVDVVRYQASKNKTSIFSLSVSLTRVDLDQCASL